MREILFRGKRKDNGEWVYGAFSSCDFDGESGIICKPSIIDYDDNCLWCEVIPSTVGQYTGLHDATKWGELSEKEQREFLSNHRKEEWNGKKIFEGDIIDTPDRLIEVVWFNKNAQFDLHFIRHTHDIIIVNFKGIYMRDLEAYEVVGNIYDNPELLKGE